MKCFHHNDMDGRCAGAIVAQFENDYNPDNYFEVDYVQKLPIDKIEKDEKVYFVDYSFSVNTESVLREIMKITKNLIWIDHHKSSMELLSKRVDLKSIDGIIGDGISGAALTYMYLYSKTYAELPIYIKYVSDFDCWHLKLPKVMEFKYGVEYYDYTVLSDFWLRLYDNEKDDGNDFLNQIIENGEIIKRYSENVYDRVCRENSYEREVEGYRALILNRDGFSQLFGDRINDYDVCIIWHYSGDKYVYSIYSANGVDVSEIAKKFGGGGHKGAAGFSSKELLFL